jgi:hypothetical protein
MVGEPHPHLLYALNHRQNQARHSDALLKRFTDGLDLSCAFTQRLKGIQQLSLRFDEFTPSSERLKAETRDEMKVAVRST